MSVRVGLIGARGHTGAEIVRLMGARGDMDLVFAASRSKAGAPLTALFPEAPFDVTLSDADPREATKAGLDLCILAAPDGAAAPFVAAFDADSPNTVLVDLSADYRFDDAWLYGLPEVYGRTRHAGATRIANPGCYATALQLALHPLAPHLDGPASVFGVSGYSGAGTTPNPRNDPARLKDNLMPYALAGHKHEREARRHLGADVRFSPHVAAFFRGIVVTAHAPLLAPISDLDAPALYARAYGEEPLIRLKADEPVEARDVSGVAGAVVGPPVVVAEEDRVVVTAGVDNLLKGAAVQALQNAALALGLDEFAGLEVKASETLSA